MKKVGIIGCGNMGEVLIEAASELAGSENVVCYDIDEKKLNKIKDKYKLNIATSNPEVVKFSEVVIIAVKPQQIKALLEEIKSFINDNHVTVSIAAGVKISTIEKVLGKRKQIIRVMPNLPLKVSCGVSAMCKNSFCKDVNYGFVKNLFGTKGVVLDVKEKFIDIITAISGSGPAYVFYISEIIQKIARKLGLNKNIVEDLVNYTILGAANMLIKEKISAEKLKNAVASKGGTTEQALDVFYKHNLEKIFYKAIYKAFKRAQQLSSLVDKG
ncbi:MAG: pyrroline-5-carboxylate reductase [Endomicrobiia bacterium]